MLHCDDCILWGEGSMTISTSLLLGIQHNPQGCSENNLGRWIILLKYSAFLPAELYSIFKTFSNSWSSFWIQILSFSVFALPPSFIVTCSISNTIHHFITQIINEKINRIRSRGGTWVSPCDISSNLDCVPMTTALRHPLVSYSCYSIFFFPCLYVPRILVKLS